MEKIIGICQAYCFVRVAYSAFRAWVGDQLAGNSPEISETFIIPHESQGFRPLRPCCPNA
jgi:hypothetical protein